MLRVAVIASILIPALAHATPPGMTPPHEPGSSTNSALSNDSTLPSDAPPSSDAPPPSSDAPPSSYAPPSSFVPSLYPSASMGPGADQPLALEPTGTEPYRHLTIGMDFAAICTVALAINYQSEALAKLSIGTYLLGAPLVHAVKGHSGRALASAGLRLGLPILGGLIGHAMKPDYAGPANCDDCDSDEAEAVLGIGLGLVTAIVVDSAYLARGDKPTAPPQPQWGPTLNASQGGFSPGTAGSF